MVERVLGNCVDRNWAGSLGMLGSAGHASRVTIWATCVTTDPRLFRIFGTLGSVCWSGHDAPASRLILRKSDISFKDSKRHKMPQRIRESLTRDRSLLWKFTEPLEAAGSSCVSSAAQLLVTGVIEQLRPRQTNYSVNEKCERLIDFLAWSPPGLRLSEAEPLT